MNHQGLSQGRRGFQVTVIEPNSVSSARKHATVRGDSERIWHKASACGSVTAHKHLSLMVTAHMPQPNHTPVPWSECCTLSCQDRNLAWELPKLSIPSLSVVLSKQHPKEHFLFALSNITVSLVNLPCLQGKRESCA